MTHAASSHPAATAIAYQRCAGALAAAAIEQHRFSVELAEDAEALAERARQMLRERRDQRRRLAGTGAELLRVLERSSTSAPSLPQPEAPLQPAARLRPAA
jgi:hypothetical protein